MTIADRIKAEREKLNLSQEELAKACGYADKTSISKIENAGDNITLKKIRRIADALGVRHSYLLGWEEEIETFDTPEEFELRWHQIGGGRHPIELTDHEHELILEYRVAPEEDKKMVDRILAYASKLKEKEDGKP